MMTEIMLVEGVSDVQLISYFLQRVYDWSYVKDNDLGIVAEDKQEHIETLSKNGNQLVVCGVGGNGKFAHFVEQHRINNILVEQEISSLMVVTDRDESTDAKIAGIINKSLKNVSIRAGEWIQNSIIDSFGQPKDITTYLLIIPEKEKGALEKVIIDALYDIQEEKELIQEVVEFIESLKGELAPELNQLNKANKATVGTFFSVRNPKNAMRSFGAFISKIDWKKSESLKRLFSPFEFLGVEKPQD